jgi:hypothetical protein
VDGIVEEERDYILDAMAASDEVEEGGEVRIEETRRALHDEPQKHDRSSASKLTCITIIFFLSYVRWVPQTGSDGQNLPVQLDREN